MLTLFATELQCLNPQDRPAEIQYKIDQSFAIVARDKFPKWNFNGEVTAYYMCGFNEIMLFTNYILDHPDQTEFNFCELGGAHFRLTTNLAKTLFNDSRLKNRDNLQIRLFNNRAEQYNGEPILGKNISVYHDGQFKIENLENEFATRYSDLKIQFDVVITRWTFTHLVDPAGTFIQAYNLLRPGSFMIFDRFYVLLDDQPLDANYNTNIFHLVRNITSSFFFQESTYAADLMQFYVQRKDNTPCHLPLAYDKYEDTTKAFKSFSASGCVTRFKTLPEFTWVDYDTWKQEHDLGKGYYGDKELYDYVKSLHAKTNYGVSSISTRQ